MTPFRQPVPVRGDIPGLLCRGTLLSDVILLDVDGLPVSMDNSIVISPEPGWTTVYGGIDEPGCERFRTLIWHSPIAAYAALHWLADRGHPCLWMLPNSHGGKVEPWDGLSAWEVSVILVSASVARVAEGGKPVSDLYRDEGVSGDLVSSVRKSITANLTPEQRKAAIADGAAFLVPGGVAVLVPGAA